MIHLDLFTSFSKVGLFGFGGGPSLVPLLQEEVVSLRGWLTAEEFLDAFALGNALPGPIATKMAAYIGFKVAGWTGVVAGLLGMVLPTALLMLALLGLYLRFREAPYVEGFLRGVRPVVIALLLMVALQFAPRALGAPREILQNVAPWLLMIASLTLAWRFDVHPALLIVLGGLVGVVFLS